jgi:hypothetical protein
MLSVTVIPSSPSVLGHLLFLQSSVPATIEEIFYVDKFAVKCVDTQSERDVEIGQMP